MPTPVKTVVAQAITAWSFSRYNDYKKCPAYAMYKHVRRIQEPGSAALDRGSEIHAIAQKFSKMNGRTKTPAELKTFEQEFRALQKRKVLTEEQWAFDAKWRPTNWFDDRGTPEDKKCRCRVVVDCCYLDLDRNILVVIDHKTGKINPTHLDQLSLYALAGMIQYPSCAGVEVQLWYLDHGVLAPDDKGKVYMREEMAALKKDWEKKTKPMLADRRFAPKPSSGCGYCFYSKAKGGPCKF